MGSGWQGVYNILQQHGYRVGIVQNPTISLDDDVAVTKRVIAVQPGPVVLVGHSYGGVVITEAGNDPKVAGLVYIAAFAPDRGDRSPRSSPIRRQVRPYLRSFLRKTGSSCLTGRSSRRRSPPTFARTRRTSCPTPRFRGGCRARGKGQRACLEIEAKLVPGDER